MILDAGKEDPHSVCPVVQMGDTGSVQVTGQLIDVCLQLGKGWESGKRGKKKRDELKGILETCSMRAKPFFNPQRTKNMNPPLLHGVYHRFDEADS